MFENLVDENIDKVIEHCFIHEKGYHTKRIFVIYQDKTREYIWTYDSRKIDFDNRKFIGMSKIEAVFYCDQQVNNLLKSDCQHVFY